MTSQISFGALPPELQNARLAGRTASQLRRIMVEAAEITGVKVEYPKASDILNKNKRLFTRDRMVLSEAGAKELADRYGCKATCKDFLDAFVKIFKG